MKKTTQTIKNLVDTKMYEIKTTINTSENISIEYQNNGDEGIFELKTNDETVIELNTKEFNEFIRELKEFQEILNKKIE